MYEIACSSVRLWDYKSCVLYVVFQVTLNNSPLFMLL